MDIDARISDRRSGVAQVSAASKLSFAMHGFVHLKNVFCADEMRTLASEILRPPLHAVRDEIIEGDRPARLMWPTSRAVSDFVFDERIGRCAAELLDTGGVRLIEDVLFKKTASTKPTSWHRDSDFWSLMDGGALTFWIPLQATPESMTLRYVPGSHRLSHPRVLHRFEKATLSARFAVDSFAMELGDIAVHHYQTLHASAPYAVPFTRHALAIHMLADRARRGPCATAFQARHNESSRWNTIRVGDAFTNAVAPLLYRA